MIKLSIVIGTLSLELAAGSANATPIGQTGDSIGKAAVSVTIVEPTAGCHRVCHRGPVPRWGGVVRWHRHVGPNCWPVRCRPY